MFSLLMLDHSTLYYWTLSDVPHKRGSAINESAPPAISSHNTTLQGPKSTSSRTKSTIPLLSASRSSALTDNMKVTSHRTSDQVKVKVENDILSLSDEGGLSDGDELGGKERVVAINSPAKGKKRITNEVTSRLFQLITNI
jgi:hypothetical protein